MSEIRSQATPARDKRDLADIIHIHVCANNLEDCIGECRVAASDVIADGWSKPRTVNSAAEMDALPVGSVLARNLDHPDEIDVYVKRSDTAGWRYLPLPMTVLFTPGEAG